MGSFPLNVKEDITTQCGGAAERLGVICMEEIKDGNRWDNENVLKMEKKGAGDFGRSRFNKQASDSQMGGGGEQKILEVKGGRARPRKLQSRTRRE